MEVHHKASVLVCKTKCLECKHLVPFAESEFDCTVESGNDMCPAQSITITLGARVDKAAADIVAAMIAGNGLALARYYDKLSKYHETVQSQVMTEVQARLKHRQLHEAQ